MPISFTDVARSLDEIVEMEEGVRSERLCVALARRRFPGLIATESKKDGGEDAIYLGEPLADLGVPGVAVSITNTIEKVKKDATAIRISGVKIGVLVFYTPRKVTNTKAKEWAKEIHDEFCHELVVIPREDIIHSLLEPENAYICEAYLDLEIGRSQNLERIIPGAAASARDIATQWLSPLPINAEHLIELQAYRLDEQGSRVGEAVGVSGLKSRLADSERLILLGGPGAGKSTALSIMAAAMLDDSSEMIPLLVSIPEFLDARKPILDYVAEQPAFRSAGISVDDLASLAVRGQINFLLNGWNEVGGADSERASRELRKIAREYPAVGVLVSSRPQKVDPFNGAAVPYELAGVSDSQRETYIRAVLPGQEQDLLQQIDGSHSLNSLSRSPFILEQLVTLYATDGSLPDTKAEVLAAIILSTEKKPEHVSALMAEPLLGFSRNYLDALAAEMTMQGRVSLSNFRACQVISAIRETLATGRQREVGPEPQSVLRALCAHHLLEEIGYPEPAFRFSHQQFQESFGASALQVRAINVIEGLTGESVSLFQEEVIDIPVWEESLLLLAERLGSQGGDQATVIVSALVEWTTVVDPVFAARLYAISGNLAEQTFSTYLEPLLRRWYECDSSAHRACAVAAMVATGSDRFANILWTLLDDPNRDIRVTALDAAGPIPISVLGVGWEARIAAWPPERRSEFIDTIGHSGSQDGVDVAFHFANNDLDTSVRLRAIDVLWFQGSRAKLIDALRKSRDDVFRTLVKRDQLPEKLSPDLVSRRDAALAEMIAESEDAAERIQLTSRILGTRDATDIEQLKIDLDKIDLSGRDYQLDRSLYDIVQKIRSHDEEWVNQWVARRISAGELLLDEWSLLGRLVDSGGLESILDELMDPESDDSSPRRGFELLAASIDSRQIDKLLDALASTRHEFENAPNPPPEHLRNCHFRIRDLLFTVPVQSLASVVAGKLSVTEDHENMWELLELLGVRQAADFDGDTVRDEMDASALDQLRQTLRELVSVVENAEDYDGKLGAGLATAIGRFGAEEDVPMLQRLINLDVERVNQGRELFRCGNHRDPRASGSRTRWDHWLVRALISIAGEDCADFLLALLDQPDYEDQAARGLYSLVRVPSEETSLLRSGVQSYKVAASLQVVSVQRFSDEEKRQFYAEAVRQHLVDVITTGDEDPAYPSGRLKRIASSLSLFGRAEDAQIILEQLSKEGKWDAWIVVDTIEQLVFSGLKLNSPEVMNAIDPILTKMTENVEWYKPNDQAYLLRRCVTILLLSDEPKTAIDFLSQVYPSRLSQHDLYDIVEIAGYANSGDVEVWLEGLLSDPDLEDGLAGRILQALAMMDGDSSESALLAYIGLSDKEPIRLEMKRETIEPYAAALASAIAKDATLLQGLIDKCAENLDQNQKNVVATIVGFAKKPELDVAALQLIRDGEEIPWPLRKSIKRVFYEDVQIPGRQGWFEVNPVLDTNIRPRLLELAHNDDDRRKTAYDLLGKIDKWRLESGKPADEPRHPELSSGLSWPIVSAIG